jgi:hypothetical protein
MRQGRSIALRSGLFGLIAVAGLGCGSAEEEPAAPPAPQGEAASPAPPAAAPAPSPAAPAAPETAAAAPQWAGEFPPDFPADVPRYPGVKVTSARGTAELGVVVSLDSADALETVVKFYADGLAASGWQTQIHETPEGTVLVADKEGRQAHAFVHAGGQGTLVDMIIARVE